MKSLRRSYFVAGRFTLTVLLSWLFHSGGVNAAIPRAAMEDPRYAMGYLVVTHYPGVDSTGVSDSHAGIQEAITDAFNNNLVLLFPSGTYLVSDVLACYTWQLWGPIMGKARNPHHYGHVLVGSSLGNRPLIKLMEDAPGFNEPDKPRPLIVYRNFVATTSSGSTEAWPADPLKGNPANFKDGTTTLFNGELRNIDFDTGGNPGAIGVSFAAAQGSSISNVRINATGSYAGFNGIPGRNGATVNVEVEGGRFGITNQNMNDAGTCIVGAKLYNQTHRALVIYDFTASGIVGFDIRCLSDVAIEQLSYPSSGGSSLTMVDGVIDMVNGGLAVSNPSGRNLYMENIFINHADHLIQSGSQNHVAGADDWKHVVQYVYSNQQRPLSGRPPYREGDAVFNTWSLINGVKSQMPEPIKNIEDSIPATDYVSMHIWETLPYWEGEPDGTVNIADFGATGNDAKDDYAAIQEAIDFASTSGNGQVFIPKGEYVTHQSILLRHNTKFFGASQKTARINTDGSWAGGTSGYTINTVDDASATTYLGYLTIFESDKAANHGSVSWKAGEHSMIKAIETKKSWKAYVPNQVRYKFHFTGNAGGKHYICPFDDMTSFLSESRIIMVEGTHNPLTFYACNLESSKVPPDNLPGIDVNLEIVNARNVRVHNIKREGSGASVRITDSQNIGIYGIGRQKINLVSSQRTEGYVQIRGSSHNIVVANVETDYGTPTVQRMLKESLNGLPEVVVDWPECVSVYIRGTLPDVDTRSESQPKKNDKLQVYPNPFNKGFSLDLYNERFGDIHVRLFDLKGKSVWTHTRKDVSPGRINMHMHSGEFATLQLKEGIYLLSVTTSSNTWMQKLIHLRSF